MNITDFQVDKIVRIAGTNYDRRRKLTTSDVRSICKEYNSGSSVRDLANKYGVTYFTIMYHVDPYYKRRQNAKRNEYAPSVQDSAAQRISRVAHKRAILEGRI